MKAKWLIDEIAFASDINPLFKALDAQGIEYKKTDGRVSVLSGQDLHSSYFSEDDCVVFYGSLEFASIIRKNCKWIPGVFYNKTAYNCLEYYPIFGKYLLNSNYIMLPFGELERQKEFLYEKVGEDRTIFIRPNAGNKIFTGNIVYKEHFDEDIHLMGFYDTPVEELVIVAEPKNITAEWRFVIVNGEPVTGSLYKENNIVGSSAKYPKEAYELASKLCKLYNPDSVWVIDICLTKGGEYKLLEIGCFSCAGLYACDRDIIVNTVSKAAIEEYNKFKE